VVAWILAAIARRSLVSIDFDRRVAQWGFQALAEFSPSKSPARLAGRLIAWTVMLVGFLVGLSAFVSLDSRCLQDVAARRGRNGNDEPCPVE